MIIEPWRTGRGPGLATAKGKEPAVNMHATATVTRHSLRLRTAKLLLCAAGAATLAVTAMGPAAAGVGPLGTGTPLCNAGYAGTMSFLPALVSGGTAHSEEVAVKMKFTGCSGGTPVPAAGVYVAKGIIHGPAANACTSFFAPPLTPPPIVNFTPSAHLDGPVTWSPGTISPSNVSFSRMRIWTGPAGHFLVRLPAAASLVGGSYGITANLSLRTLQTYTTSCPTGGLSALNIVPANPAAAISQGTW